MNHKNNKEGGSIVVEASLVLPIFLIAAFLFINLINIFILHNKIQFAINAAAHEVSTYSYLYEKLGIRDAEKTIKRDGKKYTKHIDKVADSINKMVTGYEQINRESKKTINKALETMESMREFENKLYVLEDEVSNLGKNVLTLLNDVNDELPVDIQNKLADMSNRFEIVRTNLNGAVKDYDNSKHNGQSSQEAEKNIVKEVENYYNTLIELKKDYNDIKSSVSNIKKAGKLYKNHYNTVVDNVKDTVKQFGRTVKKTKELITSCEDMKKGLVYANKNRKETMIGAGFILADGLKYLIKNETANQVYKSLTKRYIEEDFLIAYGVSNGFNGMDFSQSTYLADKKRKMIDIMVSYDINLTPFRIVLSNPTLKITQRVTIPAWLNGDGNKKDEWKASREDNKGSTTNNSTSNP